MSFVTTNTSSINQNIQICYRADALRAVCAQLNLLLEGKRTTAFGYLSDSLYGGLDVTYPHMWLAVASPFRTGRDKAELCRPSTVSALTMAVHDHPRP